MSSDLCLTFFFSTALCEFDCFLALVLLSTQCFVRRSQLYTNVLTHDPWYVWKPCASSWCFSVAVFPFQPSMLNDSFTKSMLFFSKKYNARDLQFQHCSFKVIWNWITNQKVYVSCLRTTTWSPSSTSDASKRPNDLEASFFLDFGWCIGESGAQSAILWNLFVFFLLFAKFGLKTKALLLEKMLMEIFYTGFHIHSKQFSLYPLVMWSSKTYILTILYNNDFSSDS